MIKCLKVSDKRKAQCRPKVTPPAHTPAGKFKDMLQPSLLE
jgi:hypothetical protein